MVYAPAERADTLTLFFLLYPFLLCGKFRTGDTVLVKSMEELGEHCTVVFAKNFMEVKGGGYPPPEVGKMKIVLPSTSISTFDRTCWRHRLP